MRQTVEEKNRLCSHLANFHFNLTQQNVCSVHDVPDDGQQKQQRRDEAAKHIWFVLSKVLAILVELLAFALEFFGDVNCVVGVEGSVDPRDIDRRHQDGNWTELETGGKPRKIRKKSINWN
jgi:hypothetical protein